MKQKEDVLELDSPIECKNKLIPKKAKSPQPFLNEYRLDRMAKYNSKEGYIEINLGEAPEERSRSIEKLYEDAKYRQINRARMQEAVI